MPAQHRMRAAWLNLLCPHPPPPTPPLTPPPPPIQTPPPSPAAGHLFEPGFGLGSRLVNFAYKGGVFAFIGMCAGLVGTATSNGLLELRKKMDPSFAPAVSAAARRPALHARQAACRAAGPWASAGCCAAGGVSQCVTA